MKHYVTRSRSPCVCKSQVCLLTTTHRYPACTPQHLRQKPYSVPRAFKPSRLANGSSCGPFEPRSMLAALKLGSALSHLPQTCVDALPKSHLSAHCGTRRPYGVMYTAWIKAKAVTSTELQGESTGNPGDSLGAAAGWVAHGNRGKVVAAAIAAPPPLVGRQPLQHVPRIATCLDSRGTA
jgi:hypothetical protein